MTAPCGCGLCGRDGWRISVAGNHGLLTGVVQAQGTIEEAMSNPQSWRSSVVAGWVVMLVVGIGYSLTAFFYVAAGTGTSYDEFNGLRSAYPCSICTTTAGRSP